MRRSPESPKTLLPPGHSRREMLGLLGATVAGTVVPGVSPLARGLAAGGSDVGGGGNGRGDGLRFPATLFAPKTPPPFPCFAHRQAVVAEAQRISDGLHRHILAWFAGRAPAAIPPALLPPGRNEDEIRDYRLVPFEELGRQRPQWAVRPATPVLDRRALAAYFPDPHCSYALLPSFLAPFGCRAVLEGEFPRGRFFSIQATPSFHPEAYRYDYAGVGEVPLVDADIEPLSGHTNPFRVGADRYASRRGYRVVFELTLGNPAATEPAFRPPHYRAPGNVRRAGAILFRGPWGDDPRYGDHRGSWDVGQIWLRLYLPDRDAGGDFGGVELPRVHYELPDDGRRFFVEADWSRFAARVNRRLPERVSLFAKRPGQAAGPEVGWNKQMGIFRAIVGGAARGTGWATAAYARALDRGVAGRGEDLPAPGNTEASATACNHINYLTRGMALGPGRIVALTGRLPTTPRTRAGGARTFPAAQARYWSLTAYDPRLPEADGYAGAALWSRCDEELVLDGERRYVLVLSRPADRPTLATAEHGVTWQDWGGVGAQAWTLRWLSVWPEWGFEKTPHEERVGWRGDWASASYDERLIGRNTHAGLLGDYLPLVHYLRPRDVSSSADLARLRAAIVGIWT